MDSKTLSPLLLALMIATSIGRAAEPDWPQWRGPARTGILPAGAAPEAWPASLTKDWSVPAGEGYSSPVAAGGRVFLHARRDPDEVVTALDLATGKVLWEKTYPAPVEKNPYAKQMAKGPYSTPLVSGGHLFTLGTTGILSAWNAADGALLWRRDFSSRIDTSKLFCGTAMSPIRTPRGIVVHVGDDRAGTVMTLDPATGKDVWATDIDGPGYASPIEIALEGTPQLVTMTTRAVVGVDSGSGAVLWQFPFPDEWNENIVTPVATPTGIIISGVRQGTRALAIGRRGGTWTATETWHTPDVAMYMSSPVLAGGVLYGYSARRKGQIVAVDPASGKLLWGTEGRAGASASVIAAGDRLVVLTTEAELVVAEQDRSGYKELRRYEVASGATYAHPILLRDRLLVRDASHLTVWRLSTP